MKAFFIFLFSLLASVVSMAQNVKFDIEADLHRLDTVVANSHKYDAQKMHDINYIKRSTGDFEHQQSDTTSTSDCTTSI